MQHLGELKSTAAWLAGFGEERRDPGSGSRKDFSWTAGTDTLIAANSRRLYLLDAPREWLPEIAEFNGNRIIFDGLLHNRSELCTRFADRLPRDPCDADLVGQAYCCWGHDAVSRVKGVYALLIWDRARDLLLCARDPFGLHPLFYAELGRTLLLSPSIETLLGHPGISAELNRAGLVDTLARRGLKREETYFTQVKRVLPGHILRIRGDDHQSERYWNPVPFDRPIEWIPDEEAQPRFEALLEQAVARCLARGPAGIFLSGGLDSSAVAMVASDICRQQGRAAPWALSLVFPGLDRDEVNVQRGVATALGLPQVLLPVDEAGGPEGTLAAALEMSRTLPAPLEMIWHSALRSAALHGRQQGCRVILTGHGGDEWLWENTFLAADLLRSLNLPGLYRLWRTHSRSYHFSRWEMLDMLLWRYGARPLLRDAWHTVAVRVGASGLIRRRRHTAVTRSAVSPHWLAPDPALRAQVTQRIHESYASDKAVPRIDSYYLQDTRSRLDAPEKWFLAEETFLVGRRVGVHMHHPFLDADLVELLIRIRPNVRSEDGFAKALVRRPLARRFPHLGFERQRKSWLGAAALSMVAAEAGAACKAMGGIRTLGELGVVDPARVSEFMDDALARKGRQLGLVWLILNVEAWARAHYRPGA